VDHVIMITRGDPPKMGPKGPYGGAVAPPLGLFRPKLPGPPLTTFPWSVWVVKAANSMEMVWFLPYREI
jgi:hypothetical protein